jgi:hypothetical protein
MHYKIKNLAVAMAVGIVFLGFAEPTPSKAVTAVNAMSESTTPTVTSTAKVTSPLNVEEASALDIWLEKLAQKESEGRERIKILDTNGKYSYGCLQFQEWTFKSYGQKYGVLKDPSSWENKIYDCNVQKQLAKKMIQNEYVLWQSWYTSVMVRNLGLPPRS